MALSEDAQAIVSAVSGLTVEMNRQSRELTTIRQLLNDVVQYARGAEAEIPEFMRRFLNYMHDLHDVSYMYEERGLPVPDWIMRENERCDDRLRQLLQKLHKAGGSFDKIRREMAEDQTNKWDHTRALAYMPKENGNETGSV